MDKVKKSVLVPIIFFSWFGFPLTLRELRRYLWQNELSEDEISETLKQMPSVRYRGGLVWLGDAVADRVGREKLAGQLWAKVRQWRGVFANVPFLRAVFVSNTLSYNNIKPGSDVDLFIVTAPGRIWTARAWLLVWMNLFNLRVRSVNRSSKFSPEFFVTEQSWDVGSIAIPQDYYLSFWVADLVPIWPGGEMSTFRQANRWYANDLPIAWRSPKVADYPKQSLSFYARAWEWLLQGRLGNWLERKLSDYQVRIINRNLIKLGINPSVVADESMVKLHFNDRRAQVSEVVERGLDEFVE